MSKKFEILSKELALVLMLAAVPGAALAQEAGSDEEAAPTDEDRFTVTATYREESVQDVPISMSNFTGDMLEDSVATDLEDIADRVAGLEFAGFAPGLNRVTIRGISTQTGESSTAFYLDEVPTSSDPVAIPDFRAFDVNRVEFLRGPQGTLFGEASLGGTVRVIMNQPDFDQFEAAAQGLVSNTNEGGWNHGFDGMVNIPIVEGEVALRVVGSRHVADGYIDNASVGREDVNTEESNDIRAILAWQVSDDLKLTGSYQYSDLDVDGEWESNENYVQWLPFDDGFRDDRSNRYNLTVNYSFPWAELTSSTSYFERDTSRATDATSDLIAATGGPGGSPFTVGAQAFDIDYEVFVQEVRLASTHGGPLQWLVGVFYKDAERTNDGTVLSTPNLGALLDNSDIYEFNQWAIFGEANYAITEDLIATVGLRYFEEDNTFSTDSVGLLLPGGVYAASEDSSNSVITPRFTLQYYPTDTLMVYGTASRGFRTGGANPAAPILQGFGIPVGDTFDPDTLWNYEIGGKYTAPNNDFILNVAAYWMDWSDIQLPAPAPTGFNATLNAGSATSRGVEVEVEWHPTDYLTFTAAGNWTDATLDETVSVPVPFPPFSLDIAVEGNELPLVPQWKLSIGGEYVHPTGYQDWDFVARANASFVPERYNFADNNPSQELNDYTLVDVSLGFESDQYDVILFVDNLTDDVVEYAYYGDVLMPTERIFAPGRPRTIGLVARARFN